MSEKVTGERKVKVPKSAKKKIKKSVPTLLDWIRIKLTGGYINLSEEENRRLRELRKKLKQLQNDDMEKPITSQRSIPFQKMYPDGICKISKNYYSKMVGYYDINYDLLEVEDQGVLLETFSKLINFFAKDIHFQFFLFNRRMEDDSLIQRFLIEKSEDGLNELREEVERILIDNSTEGTNGVVKSKFIIFAVKSASFRDAKERLKGIEKEVMLYLKNMGTKPFRMDGSVRLKILYEYFNQANTNGFEFSYKKAMEENKSVKDYIAPEYFDFSKYNSFKSGEMYGASYYVDFTGAKLNDELLKRILDKDDNLAVSIHYDTYDPVEGIKLLKSTLTDVQKMKVDEQKKAVREGYDMDILPLDITTFEKALISAINDLNSTNQKLIKMVFLVTLFGKTPAEVDNLYQSVNGIVGSLDNILQEFEYQQELGLMSCAPIGYDGTGLKRYITTKNAAVLVPFSTQELFMPIPSIYYGKNALSNNMIMGDRKKLRNPNGLILGTPGSGKSMATKREILSVRLTMRDDILILDPEGEYYSLVDALQGQTVMLCPTSENYLNPLDLELTKDKSDEGFDSEFEFALINKSDFILSLCDFIAGGNEGLDNFDKGIIDSCIEEIYEKYYEDPVPENMPILEDLYNKLIQYKPSDVDMADKERANEAIAKATRIGNSLYLYVHGSQKYFNNRSNVDLRNRIISFDLRDIGKTLRDIGMMIVQDVIWNRVSANREKGISTRYYCDEFHLLLVRPQTAAYQVEIWKRFRKWGGIPTGITQNVADLLKSSEIEGILGNSDFLYLLNLDDDSQEILATKKNLSDKELSYVTSAEPGSGLILYDNIVIPFIDQYPKNTITYKLLTTKPEETLKREKK